MQVQLFRQRTPFSARLPASCIQPGTLVCRSWTRRSAPRPRHPYWFQWGPWSGIKPRIRRWWCCRTNDMRYTCIHTHFQLFKFRVRKVNSVAWLADSQQELQALVCPARPHATTALTLLAHEFHPKMRKVNHGMSQFFTAVLWDKFRHFLVELKIFIRIRWQLN